MEFNHLINSTEKLKMFLQDNYGVAIDKQDSRMVFLEQFQLDVATMVYAINSFEKLYMIINNPTQFNNIIQSNLHFEKSHPFYVKNQINALITAVHFKLSNLIENIIRTHFPDFQNQPFLKNLAMIQKIVKIDDYFYNSCKSFTYYRNSNHNNGIHRSTTFQFVLRDGQEINFIHNQPVSIPTLSIPILLENLIKTLELIFSSKIMDWRVYIKDDFAYQFE